MSDICVLRKINPQHFQPVILLFKCLWTFILFVFRPIRERMFFPVCTLVLIDVIYIEILVNRVLGAIAILFSQGSSIFSPPCNIPLKRSSIGQQIAKLLGLLRCKFISIVFDRFRLHFAEFKLTVNIFEAPTRKSCLT